MEAEVSAELDVHLICDNYATQKTPAVKSWLLRHPVSSSTSPPPAPAGSTWSSAGSPSSPTASSVDPFTAAWRSWKPISEPWIEAWNEDPKPFVWTKTADEILESLSGYLARINDSGH